MHCPHRGKKEGEGEQSFRFEAPRGKSACATLRKNTLTKVEKGGVGDRRDNEGASHHRPQKRGERSAARLIYKAWGRDKPAISMARRRMKKSTQETPRWKGRAAS